MSIKTGKPTRLAKLIRRLKSLDCEVVFSNDGESFYFDATKTCGKELPGLLEQLKDRGIQVDTDKDGKHLYCWPSEAITPDLAEQIEAHRQELLALLAMSKVAQSLPELLAAELNRELLTQQMRFFNQAANLAAQSQLEPILQRYGARFIRSHQTAKVCYGEHHQGS